MAKAASKKKSKAEWLTHPIQDLLKLLCLKNKINNPQNVVYISIIQMEKKRNIYPISQIIYIKSISDWLLIEIREVKQ